jgi:hypothetical protein
MNDTNTETPIEQSSSQNSSFKKEVVFLLIGAALALFSSITTLHLSNKHSSKLWLAKTKFHTSQKIFDERIKLIERTVKILNKVDLLDLNYIIEDGKTELARSGIGNFEEIITNRKVVTELNSEFMTVASLNNIFFGPKTKQSMKNILKTTTDEIHWWEVEQKLIDQYVKALSSELNYGLAELTN